MFELKNENETFFLDDNLSKSLLSFAQTPALNNLNIVFYLNKKR